jgi:outer membrane immunogenic protein
MPVKAPVVPPPPVTTWTGFYIGANAGYGSKDVTMSEVPLDPATQFVTPSGHLIVDPASTSFNINGGLAGGQIGYNWQFDRNWVSGIEADIDWADIKGNGHAGVNMAGFGPNFGTLNASQTVDWFGTVRARLGYLPVNSVLLFATGGLAYGKVDRSANIGVTSPNTAIAFGISGFGFQCANPAGFIFAGAPTTCFAGSQSRTSTGWTVGGGAEFEIAHNLTLKAEYLYVNLGSKGFNLTALSPFGAGAAPSFLGANFGDAAFNVVRGGMNWRLTAY